MSCPICARPSVATFRPFCSRRCADLDLGRWMTGAYAIPAAPDEADVPTDAEAFPEGAKPH